MDCRADEDFDFGRATFVSHSGHRADRSPLLNFTGIRHSGHLKVFAMGVLLAWLRRDRS